MKTFKKTAIALAATLGWSLSLSAAQIPAGTYTNSFNGTAALYDVSGTYEESVAGISLECTFNMDANGKFIGQGAAVIKGFSSYDVGGKIDATFTGTVKSVNNVTRVSMIMRLKGNLIVEGQNVKVSANMKENMEIDETGRYMSGTVSGTVTASAPGHGSQTEKIPPTPVQMEVPGNGNGAWNLTLNLAPGGNKYSGTATAALVGGKSHPLTVAGTYSPKSDTSKLVLKGQQGMTLTLMAGFQNAQVQFQNLKGKALGQQPHTP